MLDGRTIEGLARAPAALFLLAALCGASHGGPSGTGQTDEEEARDALLGAPLVVDGERIPDARIQRELVLGPGRAVLERTIDAWTIESELLQRAQKRALAEVASPEAEGYDAAFAEALAAERAAVEPDAEALEQGLVRAVQALGVETEEELEAAVLWRFGGAEELALDVASELRFDRTFLPDDPGAWPEITLAAFAATPETARQLEIARRGWEASERARKHGLAGSGTEAQRAAHRDVVRGTLRPWMGLAIGGSDDDGDDGDGGGAVVATADLDGDGEPDLVAATEALWPAVRAHVTPEDVENAKRWLATERLVRARLAREEVAVTPVAVSYDEPEPRPADGFSPEGRAVHRALRDAFVGAHAAEALADAELQERGRRAAGNARVHVEVMHLPTVDLARRVWLDGERERARERASAILTRLRAVEDAWMMRQPYEGKPANPGAMWREELTANGDLEASELRGTRPDVPPHMPRGVLGAHTHAQLLQALGEDERWRFVRDRSLADRLFEIPPGTFGGPWDGRFGVVLARGTAFQEARSEPPETALRAWILARAFERYAREARAAAEIRGFD